jgi:hypothetical protein
MSTTTSELTPPADDEIVTQILERRRRRTPLLTLALVVAVAAAGAFVGGAEAQKHFGTTASSPASSTGGRGNLAQRLASLGGKGSFFAGGPAGAATAGTVTLINGSDLYVTDSSGNTVIVHAKSARVTKTTAGSLRSIRPGNTVTVAGTQAANGSYTARSIALTGNG